jgi:asparaginyl-tRNA synthetase
LERGNCSIEGVCSLKKIKIKEITADFLGKKIKVCGWVRTVRDQKKFGFIQINDGSTFKGLQVVVEASLSEYQSITTGSAIVVEGVLVESKGLEQKWEVVAGSVIVLGECSTEDYPLQKKRHSFEFLRTIAHLRPRTNTLGAVMRVRNALAVATHEFFQKRGFLYVQTPIITGSDCEGGGEQFLVTTLDLLNVSKRKDGGVDFDKDFFQRPTYLTVSGQLNGEALACALGDIYTFGPTFRAENSNTSRHVAEFWMIEPEMAFATIEDNIECAEKYLQYIVGVVLERCPEDMEFFDAFVEKGIIQRLYDVVNSSAARITYTEAVEILQKSGKKFEHVVAWGQNLQSEHERYLAEEYYKKPVIVTDYPSEIKAFYMKQNGDQKTVAAMDVLVPKIGEIIGGSQREDNYEILHKKILDLGLKPQDYWWYLELRKYGTVPHSGFGAGFERVVQFVTGIENIRDVIPFPRYPGHADF